MKNNTINIAPVSNPVGTDFVNQLWEKSWTYIKTVVDVVHEPVLILDKEFRVMAANEPFYRIFQVEAKDTEKKVVYELGNGQWNIPDLKKLIEDILPKNTFFKSFEVTHDFPSIGRKVMLLNARRIYVEDGDNLGMPPIILLAMEDITSMMDVALKLAEHTNHFEKKIMEQAHVMEASISLLKNELDELRKTKKTRS